MIRTTQPPRHTCKVYLRRLVSIAVSRLKSIIRPPCSTPSWNKPLMPIARWSNTNPSSGQLTPMHNVPSTIPATRRKVTIWMYSILVPLGIVLLAAMIWLWPSGTYQELSLDDPYGTTEGFAVESGSVSSVTGRSCDGGAETGSRSEEHTSELQSRGHLVCRLLREKTNKLTSWHS